MVNTIHLAGPDGSNNSQPDLTMGCKFSNKIGYVSYNYFVTGEDCKAFFLFPVLQETPGGLKKNYYVCSIVQYCFATSRRGLVQEDKRMVLEYTHGLFIT
jgi:hypothetical protein